MSAHELTEPCMQQSGETALIKAADNGYLEIVDKLLVAGVDVDLTDSVCILTLKHAVLNRCGGS